MKKFTRKHYNKKLVALGLSCFMGIGLISTGFAAWVMSKDTTETPEGNVNVAVVTDASAKIMLEAPASYDAASKIWTLNDNFSFDAKKTDREGRLRFGGAGDGEDLSITIKGYLTGNEGVAYDLTAQVGLPAGVTAAIEQGYLAWADTDYSKLTDIELDENGKFTITLGFVWGEKFGGLNPCEYYDTEGKGKAISDEQMKTELDEFHAAIITGLTESKNEDVIEKYTGKFTVTLSATPAPVDQGAGA